MDNVAYVWDGSSWRKGVVYVWTGAKWEVAQEVYVFTPAGWEALWLNQE